MVALCNTSADGANNLRIMGAAPYDRKRRNLNGFGGKVQCASKAASIL